ncbi:MAG: phosphatase PAP2 family protein [Candidatus Portnoybacteria bacterium]|nr:phosphatase PAP2 family protein [Candidatus Portnoybacteria bacterium]MDD4982627.1 phosphatase PAP2 family protein [Candidatus Portnoybacteria bacterium]
MDYYLFQQINGLAGRWAWLDYFGIFTASYLQYFVAAALLAFLALGNTKQEKIKNRVMVVLAFASALVARFGFASPIYEFFMRLRPFAAHAATQLIAYDAARSSFPSGHASFFFALAAAIYLFEKGVYLEPSAQGKLHRRNSYWFFAAALIISFARVFVGVHYPGDILAGTLIGIFSGWLVWNLFNLYQNKKAR